MTLMSQMSQRQKVHKAKVALGLYREHGQVPKEAEIDKL